MASAIQNTHFPAKYPAQWALEVAHVKFDLIIIIFLSLELHLTDISLSDDIILVGGLSLQLARENNTLQITYLI